MTNRTEDTSFLVNSSPEKILYINEESDFPVQDGTTITLDTSYLYQMSSVVTTAKRFIGDGLNIKGMGATASPHLIYTGTGNMFTCVDGITSLDSLIFSCTSGTIFALSGVGGAGVDSQLLVTNSRCTSCTNIGSFNGMDAAVVDIFDITSVTGNGATFAGSGWLVCSLTKWSMAGLVGATGIDLGTAVFGEFEGRDLIIVGDGASTAISGASGSANIVAGSEGELSHCNFSLIGTALSGLNPQDTLWCMSDNAGVPHSRSAADAFITSLETITVSSSGVFYHVSGTSWSSSVADRFTVSSAGIVTYIGRESIEVSLIGLATIAKVGGGANEIEVRFAKNWTSGGGIAHSGGTTKSADATSVPLAALISMTTGDTIRMITANNDATANIEVTKASLTIVGE